MISLQARLKRIVLQPLAAVRHGHETHLHEAFHNFTRRHPAYASTSKLDMLRATEYARLDQQGQVYLDYTGGSLYAESQLRKHTALLTRIILCQPH